MPVRKQRLQLKRAEAEIARVSAASVNRYLQYWQAIEPKSHREYYERWLFAFMSVRTQWRRNCDLFEAVRALPEGFTQKDLHACLVEHKAGMVTVRTKGIWGFHCDFWKNPQLWYIQPGESMPECRDRLTARIYGLGVTKVSFVLEMAFPATCEVVCVDTHIAKLYGVKLEELNEKTYKRIEAHWVDQCKKHNVPSAIARHVYWDQVQGDYGLNDYWAYVFERKAA